MTDTETEKNPTERSESGPPTAPDPSASGAAYGKAARRRRSRASFADWTPGPDRADPVEILELQARTRVPELVPIRYGRMIASPFTFFRGAAAIMAADIAVGPSTGLRVQLCGDAHLSNFGGFAAPDRRLVFGINDFDETHPGPFEWDLQRLAASFEIAGRDIGLNDTQRRATVRRVARTYQRAMRDFATSTSLDVWYSRLDVDGLIDMVGSEVGEKVVTSFRRNAEKAQRKDRFRALDRLTHREGDELRFVSDPPLLVPAHELFDESSASELEETIRQVLQDYRGTLEFKNRHLLDQYSFVQLARKVVGVGTVGTRAWVALLVGRDLGDPLFLQVKQAEASVLQPYTEPSAFSSNGERVVAGQSLMQAASDIFLGWNVVTGPDGVTRDYYLRQLWDWKASADVQAMTPTVLDAYARICGWTLARSHARTGDRLAIAAYLGKSDSLAMALTEFATAYADQNERDHAALVDAIASGRIQAQTGI